MPHLRQRARTPAQLQAADEVVAAIQTNTEHRGWLDQHPECEICAALARLDQANKEVEQ
jgi:hypothetical protein